MIRRGPLASGRVRCRLLCVNPPCTLQGGGFIPSLSLPGAPGPRRVGKLDSPGRPPAKKKILETHSTVGSRRADTGLRSTYEYQRLQIHFALCNSKAKQSAIEVGIIGTLGIPM